jgi:hypothetical protein
MARFRLEAISPGGGISVAGSLVAKYTAKGRTCVIRIAHHHDDAPAGDIAQDTACSIVFVEARRSSR